MVSMLGSVQHRRSSENMDRVSSDICQRWYLPVHLYTFLYHRWQRGWPLDLFVCFIKGKKNVKGVQSRLCIDNDIFCRWWNCLTLHSLFWGNRTWSSFTGITTLLSCGSVSSPTLTCHPHADCSWWWTTLSTPSCTPTTPCVPWGSGCPRCLLLLQPHCRLFRWYLVSSSHSLSFTTNKLVKRK